MPPLKSDKTHEKSLNESQDSTIFNGSFSVVEEVKEHVSGIQENIENPPQKQIRMYLLRHYPESEIPGRYHTKLENIHESFRKAYDGIFANPAKILFIYDGENGLPRVRDTAEDILRKYSIPESYIIRNAKLEGSYDSNEDPINRKMRTLQEFEGLRKIIIDRNLSEIDTIVIVSNRTYTQPFDLLSGDNRDITLHSLEARGYQFRDFTSSLDPIIPTSTTLLISPEEYKLFKGIFFNFTSASCQELQSKIENYFETNKLLYKKYLTLSSPPSLRTFCLANLIKNQEYSPIEEYYIKNCTHFSTEEKELFLQNTTDPKMQLILRKLFVTKGTLWKEEEGNLFAQEGQTEFYNLLKSSRIAYNAAISLQGNSLDPMISKNKNGAILDRRFYFEEKQKSEESKKSNENNLQEKEVIVRRNFNPNMFQKGGRYTQFIIRAHVGEGKSTYLLELIKKFSLEQENKVIFVVAKDIKDVSKLFTPNNSDTFICIDALDEASDAIKIAIKTAMKDFSGRIIITTRYSESFDLNDKMCTLYFNPIESDDYIDSRFIGNGEKAIEVKEWLKKHCLAAEVKGNPLLLNLIVLLASVSDDMKWLNDYNILSLDQIKTKSDLYENVVKFVLAKHSKDMKGQDFDPDEDLSVWMNRLGEYAFDIFSNNPKKDRKKYFDTHLSILFKSEENGGYDFIHKSFYEFFLARHLSQMKNGKGSQEIYDFRDEKKLGNWNDWRELRPVVLFYGEMLAKKENWNELEKFLGEEGLMKGDDIFGEGFFMGFEILIKFSMNIKNLEQIGYSLSKYENAILGLSTENFFYRLTGLQKCLRNTQHFSFVYSRDIINKFIFNIEISSENIKKMCEDIKRKTIKGSRTYDVMDKKNISNVIKTADEFFLQEILGIMSHDDIFSLLEGFPKNYRYPEGNLFKKCFANKTLLINFIFTHGDGYIKDIILKKIIPNLARRGQYNAYMELMYSKNIDTNLAKAASYFTEKELLALMNRVKNGTSTRSDIEYRLDQLIGMYCHCVTSGWRIFLNDKDMISDMLNTMRKFESIKESAHLLVRIFNKTRYLIKTSEQTMLFELLITELSFYGDNPPGEIKTLPEYKHIIHIMKNIQLLQTEKITFQEVLNFIYKHTLFLLDSPYSKNTIQTLETSSEKENQKIPQQTFFQKYDPKHIYMCERLFKGGLYNEGLHISRELQCVNIYIPADHFNP